MSITKQEFKEAKTIPEKIIDILQNQEKNLALSTEEISEKMGKMEKEKVLSYLMAFQEQGIVVGKEIEPDKIYWVDNIPTTARREG